MPPHFGDTDCLTLEDNGTVTSTGDIAPGLSGVFQVVKGLLVVNLEAGSGNGEVQYITFIARAHDGQIGDGVFNSPGVVPVEPLKFGPKGGC
jgi:hypothetical protein